MLVTGQLAAAIAAALFLSRAAAQANAGYDSCGGVGWTGSTDCIAGFTCKYWNEYYSQCVPSDEATSSSAAASSSAAKPPPASTSKTSAAPSKSSSLPTSSASGGVQCTGTFKSISAASYVKSLHPGWNLGNTLDATDTEGDWNNPPVVDTTFDDVKAAGFKSVRLPVTWAYHFTGSSPDWTINATWLQRVSDVVDMVIARNMPVIVNAHHDSWIWADVSASGANYSMIEEKMYRMWYQIGQKLACKSSLLAFEPINEPPGTTADHAAEQNKINNIFLKAINDAGGFNSKRVVTLVGLGEDAVKTSEWFEPPNSSFPNPWAIQFHYYSPYDFIFSAWGKTIWGSDADKSSMDTDLALIRGNFTDIPLLMGEYDASPVNTEPAGRWKWFDYLTRDAAKYNISTIMWDNGDDHLNRATHQWRDPVAIDILMKAAAGITNSLPDSTTDPSAPTQYSSAFLFHKVGDAVSDVSLPFLFNGNTLKSAKVGSTALTSSDYAVSGSNLTFTSSFLSKYLSATASEGSKANVTLSFSAGAELQVQIIQWDVPTVTSSSSAASAVPSGSNLWVPVTWKGLHTPACVRALESDGTPPFDSWTIYLGPLQQGRSTFSNQWTWDWGEEGIYITSAAVAAVIAANESTVFTIEAYPRVPGNYVNYTLTV